MSRRKPAAKVRHRAPRPSVAAGLQASVGRGAVVAVGGGLLLLTLIVVAALIITPDRGAGEQRADGGRSAQGPTAARGQSQSAPLPEPTSTAPGGGTDGVASTPSPSVRPQTAATTSAPTPSAATSSPAPSASTGKRPGHHGKPPWSTSHPKPAPGGHGAGGRH